MDIGYHHMVLVLLIFFLLYLLIMFFMSLGPFNLLSISRLTRSLDCVISFNKDSVTLQDRSLGRMIGTGYESHGLYQL